MTNRIAARILQNRPGFLKALSCARCQIDEQGLELLCEGLLEQKSSLEILDLSNNGSRIEATTLSATLAGFTKLRRLKLSNAIKGPIDGPLLRLWNTSPTFDPWRLEQIDLSGWKVRRYPVISDVAYADSRSDEFRHISHHLEIPRT